MPAIAQDRQRIAKAAHLAQAMRDEDDGRAPRLLGLDDLAQPIDVAPRQGGCRLVEQKDSRLAKQRSGDFDLLPDGEIERAHLVAEPDIVHSQPGEMCAHLGLGGAPPDNSDRIGRRIGHQHVLEHRQVADERHLLEGGLDAALMGDPRARQLNRLAKQSKRSRIRGEQPA